MLFIDRLRVCLHASRCVPVRLHAAAWRRRAAGCTAWVLAVSQAPAVAAGLSLPEALALARQATPALQAAESAVAAATAAQPAAGTLPDPRLVLGLENLPAAGPDRWNPGRDPDTMQRFGLMQDVPNRARRAAQVQGAQARVDRERAAQALTALTVRRETTLAWLAVFHAQRRQALLAGVQQQNRLLQDTLPSRIAAGQAAPAELTMARQEALALDDRADELVRDVQAARAVLRRWVGLRADEALLGGPPVWAAIGADTLRADVPRHAELLPLAAQQQGARAELAEADAAQHGDWSWEVAYSRRPRHDDMLSVQIRIDLPWQRTQRQQPLLRARQLEIERIEAERQDLLRQRAAELDTMLADGAALDAQLARAQGPATALAAEREALALASYRAGRGDLGAVLAARAQAVELQLRAIDIEARRDALRARLAHLIAE